MMQKDPLFTTSVIINGEHKTYRVSFSDDAYHFVGDGNEAPSFQLRRVDDEWKLDGELNDISRQQAINALESYLLSQH